MKLFALFCLIAAAVATPKVRLNGNTGACEIERLANGDLKSTCDIAFGGSSIEKNAVQITNLETLIIQIQTDVEDIKKTLSAHDIRITQKAQKGETGAQGLTGARGSKGSTGAPGSNGSKGQKGAAGSNGSSGS